MIRGIKIVVWGFLLGVGCLALLVVLAIGGGILYFRWEAHLPSDKRSLAFFNSHRGELDSVVEEARIDSNLTFVEANWVGYGKDAADPAHIACSKKIKRLGAQFLRQDKGVIEIYFWGIGGPIMHDSYKGFVFVPTSSGFLKQSSIVTSLDHKALPTGKYAPVEDGSYVEPIIGQWYVIRWECG